jgi:hypothetical protein
MNELVLGAGVAIGSLMAFSACLDVGQRAYPPRAADRRQCYLSSVDS